MSIDAYPGPSAVTGPVGPPGPQGEQGTQGPQGNTGPQGSQGAQGTTGDAGPQGVPGPTGPQGNVGPQGSTGPSGPTGATGATGATGLAGPPGATGAPGPQGLDGADGAPGPQGEQGIQGPPGGSIVDGFWNYATATTPPPALGGLRTTPEPPVVEAVYTIYISGTDADGLYWSGVGGAAGDELVLRDTAGNSQHCTITTWTVTVPGASGYVTVATILTSASGTLAKNQRVEVQLVRQPEPGPAGPPGPEGPQGEPGADGTGLTVPGTPRAVVRYDAAGTNGEAGPAILDASGNWWLGAAAPGTSAVRTLVVGNGTAPSAAHPVDAVQLWSADRGATAGKGSLHLRTEDGTSHVLGDRVGINNLAPAFTLEVTGTVRGGDTRVDRLGIGNAVSTAARLVFAAESAQKILFNSDGVTQRYGFALATTVVQGFTPPAGRFEFGQMATADGTTFTRQFMLDCNGGSFAIGTAGVFGTGAARVLGMQSGTAPTTSPADAVQLWSADRAATAGKASLHLRTEDGTSHVLGDRVGIGTLTPTCALDVVGALDVSDDATTRTNLGLGTAATQPYEEGTFTATGTGFAGTAPSGTARYAQVGKQATVVLPLLSGTSNATSFSITGLPVALRPAIDTRIPVSISDTLNSVGVAIVNAAGTIDIYPETYTNWPTTGPKALNTAALTYVLP